MRNESRNQNECVCVSGEVYVSACEWLLCGVMGVLCCGGYVTCMYNVCEWRVCVWCMSVVCGVCVSSEGCVVCV